MCPPLLQLRAPLSEATLRLAWERMRMKGDFDQQMRNRAVRRAIEAAARAMQTREYMRTQRSFKKNAANDAD